MIEFIVTSRLEPARFDGKAVGCLCSCVFVPLSALALSLALSLGHSLGHSLSLSLSLSLCVCLSLSLCELEHPAWRGRWILVAVQHS